MILKALTLSDLQTARLWRNQLMAAWRTPYMLTEKMQQEFYENVISDRRANMRYWGFHADEPVKRQITVGCNSVEYGDTFIGYGGIENITWETRTGEISLLIDPDLVDSKEAENDYEIVSVPAMKTADELGLRIVSNMIMLGALVKKSSIFPVKALENALKDLVKSSALQLDIDAVRAGTEFV